MQPSLEKELRSKIRELQENQFMTGTVILHQITRSIRECDFLSDSDKDKVVELIWKGRENK